MRKRQLTAAVLASAMAATLALTGCGDSGDSATTAKTEASQTEKETEADKDSDETKTEATEAEETKKDAGDASGGDEAIGNGETLVIGMQTNTYITDYKDNYLTKKLEEELNVNLEFYELPQTAADLQSKLSLMVTNPDTLPDIIITTALSQESILDYGTKGAFLPLNEYMKNTDTAKYLSQIQEDDLNRIFKDMTSADGNMYALPNYTMATWNMTPSRFYINQTWLDTLGMEVPTTTDELKEVLKAFVTQDPNGNGVADEIGIYGQASGTYGEDTIDALINAFVFYNGGSQNGGLSLDETGETVMAPFMTEEWRDALRYLNSLYQEGLIDPSVFTNDSTQFKATLNNETNIVGLTTAGSYSSNWTDCDNNANFLEMDMIAPFSGPEGVCYTPYTEYASNPAFFITSNCENPELAFRLGDYFYKPEISHTARWGEEGVDWTSDPDVCKDYTNGYIEAGIADEITLLSLTNIWSEPSNQFWHNMNPFYESLEDSNSNTSALSPYNENKKSAPLNARNVELYLDKHPDQVLPLLHYTQEEAEQISQIITDVKDFIDNTKAEFITGNRDIESGWDTYLEELNNLGIQDWMAVAQTAYERSLQ